MATTVYEVSEVLLDDGSTVTLKPAVIKVQRKGHELINNLGLTDEEKEGKTPDELEELSTRKLLDIVFLCLKRQRPDFEIEDENGKKVPNYDLMEELFDSDTLFEVIHKFLGVKLNDPKLLEAMMALAQAEEKEKESNGANSTSQNEKPSSSTEETGEASTS